MKNNLKEAALTRETRSEGRNSAARDKGGGGGGGGGGGVGSGRRFDKGGDSARGQMPGAGARCLVRTRLELSWRTANCFNKAGTLEPHLHMIYV